MHLLWCVLADRGFLCYKGAVLGEDDKKGAVLYFQWINVVEGIV
jgi:hypothetical protein